MPCKATTRAGKPCRQPAIKGGAVCRMHGGGAPQVRAAAQARLLSMVDPALGVLARSLGRKYKAGEHPTAVEISAAKDILDRAGMGKDPDQASGAGTVNIQLVVMPAGTQAKISAGGDDGE